MRFLDIISMGLRNLWRRKVRTFLTILGVIIGTASIVVMMSLGIGMDKSFEEQLKQMGSLNIINVDPYYLPDSSSGEIVQATKGKLDDKALLAMSKIDGVEAVTPMLYTGLKVVSGKYVSFINLIGINIDSMEAFDFKIAQGRLPMKEDVNGLVFGSTVPQNFYNPKNMGRFGVVTAPGDTPPVDVLQDKLELTFDYSYGEKQPPGGSEGGQNKKPKLYKATGVGILAESGSEKDWSVYMDVHQLKKLIQDNNRSQGGRGGVNEQDEYQQVMVKVKDINRVDEVQDQIKEMGFGAYSLSDIRKSMQQQSQTIRTVLGGIGAVSLFVAALGITNTMIMSIYERTREIGIMKVLGCILADIKRIFLFEAGMIGFLGGLLGIGLSFAGSYALNRFGGGSLNIGGYMPVGDGQTNISIIPMWLAFSSIGFATLIGLISGFYPAKRAMKLSALEAIKAE